MYRSPESKVLFAAMTLGFQAQFGGLDPADPQSLRFMAAQMLPDPHHPVRVFVNGALNEYDLIRRQPEALAEWGRQLRDDALRLSRPAPVDHHRRDIHG